MRIDNQLINCIDIARALMKEENMPHRHFSFIIKKNRIKAIGLNYIRKTHPLSYQFNYKWPTIHSEVSAIVRYDGSPKELMDCLLVNVRLDKNGKVMMSRPCQHCIKLVMEYGFKKVFFTNKEQIFEELK